MTCMQHYHYHFTHYPAHWDTPVTINHSRALTYCLDRLWPYTPARWLLLRFIIDYNTFRQQFLITEVPNLKSIQDTITFIDLSNNFINDTKKLEEHFRALGTLLLSNNLIRSFGISLAFFWSQLEHISLVNLDKRLSTRWILGTAKTAMPTSGDPDWYHLLSWNININQQSFGFDGRWSQFVDGSPCCIIKWSVVLYDLKTTRWWIIFETSKLRCK